MRVFLAVGATVLVLAGCETQAESPPPEPPVVDACAIEDGALADTAFVIATEPTAGARVSSGFSVEGCSRTFESTVVWHLIGRDGTLLADGVTHGGGVEGPGPFAFTIPYTVGERQVGHLEVFEEDASDGEGFPPGRTVLPLVLQP